KNGRRLLISWSTTFTKRDGTVEYVLGAGFDVTEREEAAEQIREKEATVQALMESAEQAILAIQQNGKINLANAAAENMFGYTREKLRGVSIERLLPKCENRRGIHYGED